MRRFWSDRRNEVIFTSSRVLRRRRVSVTCSVFLFWDFNCCIFLVRLTSCFMVSFVLKYFHAISLFIRILITIFQIGVDRTCPTHRSALFSKLSFSSMVEMFSTWHMIVTFFDHFRFEIQDEYDTCDIWISFTERSEVLDSRHWDHWRFISLLIDFCIVDNVRPCSVFFFRNDLSMIL